ncbi:MAG: ArnT family glycosyltransferase [Thermoleophilia bacterium]
MNRYPAIPILLLAAVILLLTVPFLNQAYHLDDREFIEFGRVQLEDPFQFYLTDYDYAWRHFDVFHTSHPPLVSSLIAVTIWLSGGESEPVLHAVFLIFPLAAGMAMYSLGRRFTSQALIAALLMVTTTGFLVMSHTLRGDVPGLAMWLAATASYIWGVDRGDRRLLALSALFLSLAVMTSYQCLSLVPLLFLYALLRRRLKVATMLPLLAPLVVFGIHACYFYSSTGEFIRFSYRVGVRFNWESMPLKGRALVAFLGGATIFPISAIGALAWRRWNPAEETRNPAEETSNQAEETRNPAGTKQRRGLLVSVVLYAALMVFGVILPYRAGDLTLTQALMLALFLASGLVIILATIRGAVAGIARWRKTSERETDTLFLSVWFVGVSVYILLLLPYVAVRYMLPLFAPLILLFVRGAESLFAARENRLRIFLLGTIGLTLAMSIPAAIADYRLANTYRTLAEQFRSEYADSDNKVWFSGELGFRYYMEAAGFPYLGASSAPESGDIVIESRVATTTGSDLLVAPIPEEFSVVAGKKTINDGFPFRIRNPWAGAAFYSHRIGPVPVMPSLEPLDEITFYRFQW